MDRKTIALMSDFGLHDPYVGIMKGVINRIAKETILIDLTHQIPAGNIQRGAYVLWQAAQDFPAGTIFLCVIDPGVGTSRMAIILECDGKTFIGPDNGLFSYISYLSDYDAWELTNPDFQQTTDAKTFHGRDIFAPAAGFAALGKKGAEFGKKIPNIVQLPTPHLVVEKTKANGEVLSSDIFGNLITTLGLLSYQDHTIQLQSWIESRCVRIEEKNSLKILIGTQTLPFVDTFNSLQTGMCGGLIGSTGLLEIVANQESAGSLLNIGIGEKVTLDWDSD